MTHTCNISYSAFLQTIHLRSSLQLIQQNFVGLDEPIQLSRYLLILYMKCSSMLLQRFFLCIEIFIRMSVFVVQNSLCLNFPSAYVKFVFLFVNSELGFLYLSGNIFILSFELFNFCFHRLVLSNKFIVLSLKLRILISKAGIAFTNSRKFPLGIF